MKPGQVLVLAFFYILLFSVRPGLLMTVAGETAVAAVTTCKYLVLAFLPINNLTCLALYQPCVSRFGHTHLPCKAHQGKGVLHLFLLLLLLLLLFFLFLILLLHFFFLSLLLLTV